MADATVTCLDRGAITADINYFVPGANLATLNDQNPDAMTVDVPIYSYIIDHPEGTILWDTGSHHEAGSGHWPDELFAAFPQHDAEEHRLDDDLEDAGYQVDDVDYLVMSHLHLDHAGGMEFFAGTDVPVFVHEKELEYAYPAAKSPVGDIAYVADDFVPYTFNWQPVGLDRETHFKDIEFIRLPGHTPGVMGAIIELDGFGTIVLTSDEVHMEANYEQGVLPGSALVNDSLAHRESRARLQEVERQVDPELMIYGHDPEQAAEIKGQTWP